MDERPMDERPMDERPMDERPMDERPATKVQPEPPNQCDTNATAIPRRSRSGRQPREIHTTSLPLIQNQ